MPDVLPAAAEADGTLLVVRFEGPDRDTVQTSLERLAGVGASVFGTVLSRVKLRHYRRYGYRSSPTALQAEEARACPSAVAPIREAIIPRPTAGASSTCQHKR